MHPSGSPQGSRHGSQGGSPSRGRQGGPPASGSQPSSPTRGSGSQAGRPAGGPQGSPTHSRAASQAGGPGGPSGGPQYPQPLGYDPARDPNKPTADNKINTRIDLPPEAYAKAELMRNAGVKEFAKRPKFNTTGQSIPLEVNQFQATSFDDRIVINQFDVSVTPPTREPGVVFRKVWEHPDTQAALRKYRAPFLTDFRRLAWSTAKLERDELRLQVDLDKLRPPPRAGKPRRDNKFFITIRQTTRVDLNVLDAYLNGRVGWDNQVLECMNFLDHVIRQGPSEDLVAIRRSFYPPDLKKSKDMVFPLNNCLHVVKGVYSSVRMNQSVARKLGQPKTGVGLGLNIDVANTVFWIGEMGMPEFVKQFIWMADPRLEGHDMRTLAAKLEPIKLDKMERGKLYVTTDQFKLLRRLENIKFEVKHRKKMDDDKPYSIRYFEFGDQYGDTGAIPSNVFIDDRENPGKQICLTDYFSRQYGEELQNPDWPVVTTKRSGMYPIDVCYITKLQRYTERLDPAMTASMIKIAVSRPNKRRAEIMAGKSMLKLETDNYLGHFGLKFNQNMARLNGRVLKPPVVQYQNGVADPKTSGRWDLRGKKFLASNPIPLMSWGFMILERSCTRQHAQAFAAQFKRVFMGHGGKIQSEPVIIDSQVAQWNSAKAVENGINEIRGKTNLPVQMLFCIVKFKDTGNYERIKKSADCRFGVLSQLVLSTHVMKNQEQYHSNVAMKVNSKLGGTTSRVPHPNNRSDKSPFWDTPTMIIGADVSHGAAGQETVPSMAALTMSMDRDACRYAASCETNGYRVEMIKAKNIDNFMTRLVPMWQTKVKCDAPKHIYYFRDGVSEGQFAHVLATEVKELKRYFEVKCSTVPKFTVIIATKRHHIRFFPPQGKGDKNSNVLPGTLVEEQVCHPFQWDFYLNSHSAIQGTARPVHYHVLLDEWGCDPEKLHAMIYQQCYQYARSTTPVSLHPSVYYADLAAGRARCHENVPMSTGIRSGPKGQEIADRYRQYTSDLGGPGKAENDEAPPLLPMGSSEALPVNRNLIRETMWYI